MTTAIFNFDRIRYVKPASIVVSTSAYSANDQVGNKLAFSGAVLNQSGFSFLLGVRFWDDVQVKAALNLYLFREDPGALAADNAAFTLSDEQSLLTIPGAAPITSSTYVAIPTTSAWYDTMLATPVPLKLNKGKTVYGALLCTGTPTFASTTALMIELIIGQVGHGI